MKRTTLFVALAVVTYAGVTIACQPKPKPSVKTIDAPASSDKAALARAANR